MTVLVCMLITLKPLKLLKYSQIMFSADHIVRCFEQDVLWLAGYELNRITVPQCLGRSVLKFPQHSGIRKARTNRLTTFIFVISPQSEHAKRHNG